MKHYSKPSIGNTISTQPKEGPSIADSEPFDVIAQLQKAQTVLQRELRNLMSESTSGKLSATSARDLVQYIKLLTELKDAEAAELANMTDEELAAIKGQTASKPQE